MREQLFQHDYEPMNHLLLHAADWHEDRTENQISIKGLLVSELMPCIKPIIGSLYVPRLVRSNLSRGGAALT